ncbi:MAG TPA: hypothetical protein VF169_01060 [Albitalea sp.]|uniref:hypothetical protein n=1 Tax=Piscinibacter sp. TaxID=1903157 RepID=UPI002ED6171C
MGNRLQAPNRYWMGQRPSLRRPRPLPAMHRPGLLATALRRLKAWLATWRQGKPRIERPWAAPVRAIRTRSDVEVVDRYRAALEEVRVSRPAELRRVAIRLRNVRAGDPSPFAAWAEDQVDGFRLRVLEEAARSPRAPGRGVNRAAVAAAELWLAAVLDAGDEDARAAAILLHEGASYATPVTEGAAQPQRKARPR